MTTISWRVGQFFIFVGLIGLVIFFMSERAGQPDFRYFIGAVITLPLGVLLMWRGRNPPQEQSARFRTLRRLGEKRGKKEK
jgi:hypothetical protein